MAGLVALMQCNILLLHITCTSNDSMQGMSYMVYKPCATACLHAWNGICCQLTDTKHAQHTIHSVMLLFACVRYDSVCPALVLYICCVKLLCIGAVVLLKCRAQ